MSADNWALCPACVRNAEASKAELQEQAQAAYGVVPISEFERLRADADAPIDYDKLRTFREDYEIYGADEGTVTVSYSGHCKVCSLGLDFKDDHPLPLEALS